MPSHDTSISAIEHHWAQLFDGKVLPDRRDISPKTLSSTLSQTFIAEKNTAGVIRFRVAGSMFDDLLGMDVRGMPVGAIFLPQSRENLSAALLEAETRPAQLRMQLRAPQSIGQPEIIARLGLLPLAQTRQDSTQFLGAIDVEGKIGRPPRRFEIELAALKQIYFYSAVPQVAHAGRGFSEERAPFHHERAPHLRLVCENGQPVCD